jgi:hypothetical protein
MLRNTKPRFDNMALPKPFQAKETSFMADRAHPATIGRRDQYTRGM